MNQRVHPEKREAHQVAGMFDRVAPAYDRLNCILSLGLDGQWRRRAARCLSLPEHTHLLDIATGTGDLLIQTLKLFPQITEATGVDLSAEMLARCRQKLTRHSFSAAVLLQQANALELPFGDASFDAVTIAFGIRNTTDRQAALREMRRVLKPGGQVVILEFSLPTRKFLRTGYILYLRTLVPMLGGLLSGRPQAYRYLNQTIEGFYGPAEFQGMMEQAGFVQVEIVPLCGGGVCIHHGRVVS